MKVLMIGDFSEKFDEGLKNVANHYERLLIQKMRVIRFDIKHPFSKGFFKFIYSHPDIIHTITAPTFGSFLMLKLCGLRWPRSKKVISSLRTESSQILRNKWIHALFTSFLKIDLMLYQNPPGIIGDYSLRADFLPNGVDMMKFTPVSKEKKIEFREKYGIGFDKFVLLHVGHIIKDRNLDIFIKLQNMSSNHQVVIVGSTYLPVQKGIQIKLENSGCKIFTEYFESIEEIYALSDCYVFPVLWGKSIDLPLSVLEAMACNIPVVAMRYPTLAVFDDCEYMLLVDEEIHIPGKVAELKKLLEQKPIIRNREKIKEYGWLKVASALEDYYRLLSSEECVS